MKAERNRRIGRNVITVDPRPGSLSKCLSLVFSDVLDQSRSLFLLSSPDADRQQLIECQSPVWNLKRKFTATCLWIDSENTRSISSGGCIFSMKVEYDNAG